MRIHIQNSAGDAGGITEAEWREAAARARDIGAGHAVTVGDTAEAFARGLAEAEIVVAAAAALRDGLPAPAPRLRLLFCTSAGLDSLFPFDWLPAEVALLNNRGTHAAKAGEYAIMALLMLANHLPLFATAQREERWERRRASTLAGRRATIVGLGSLGGAAAREARRFGMRVTGVRYGGAPHPECDVVLAAGGLDTALPDTEFLVLACPLTPATRRLLDRRRIGLLPPGAGVINIGRGGLVEQDALCDALDEGRLGGAVLDVFEPEPVPPGHRLWRTRRLVMTPHMSSDDPGTYNARSLDIFLDNLRAHRDGRDLPNRVDRERGY